MMMLLSDLFIASSLTYLVYILFLFIYAAKGNRGKHGSGSVEHEHFVDHVLAGTIGFVGCVGGAMAAIVHLVLQNTGVHIVPPSIEIIGNISRGVLLIAASMFVHHMIKEENPQHPFYYLHLPMSLRRHNK